MPYKESGNCIKNRELYKHGDLTIDCTPHDTVNVTIPVTFPQEVGKDIWLLKFVFSDKNEMELYEHTVSLVTSQKFTDVKKLLCQSLSESRLKIRNNSNSSVLVSGKKLLYMI